MQRENIVQTLFTKQVVEGILEVKCFTNLLEADKVISLLPVLRKYVSFGYNKFSCFFFFFFSGCFYPIEFWNLKQLPKFYCIPTIYHSCIKCEENSSNILKETAMNT